MKVFGAVVLFLSISTALSIRPFWRPWNGAFSAGGVVGILIADSLLSSLNVMGTVLFTGICLILSLYLISRFSMAIVARWLAGPLSFLGRIYARFAAWREAKNGAGAGTRRTARGANGPRSEPRKPPPRTRAESNAPDPPEIPVAGPDAIALRWKSRPFSTKFRSTSSNTNLRRLFVSAALGRADAGSPRRNPSPPAPVRKPRKPAPEMAEHPAYRLPSTELLNEVPARNPFDSLELKEIAARIKSKFEEFNVHGSVVQINPGPVVTTFEFKPEAGVKYSRITTLTEDLCLGLQAESILIERIPGKPTVGIEVPNTRREVISLRQILESEEFIDSNSRLTMCLGKDISGRIKVAALESMPHLLIAGSTGAGKSVMLNSMIMSILYKSTPDEVRMILVDPEAPGNGPVRGHSAPADAGDHRSQEGHLRAAQRGARNGAAVEAAGRAGRPQHRSVQQKSAGAGQRAAQPVRRRRTAGGGSEAAAVHPDRDRRAGRSDDAGARATWKKPWLGWRRWRARWACTWCWRRSGPAWT